MARRRKKRTLRPRLPARVKKRKGKRAHGHHERQQHPELLGLGLLAVGLFAATVLYLGWSGGMVGGWLADGFTGAIGAAAYAAPVALLALGALMVMRSELVDVRPFRAGLAVLVFGLMITLGKDQGGYAGQAMGGAVGVANHQW